MKSASEVSVRFVLLAAMLFAVPALAHAVVNADISWGSAQAQSYVYTFTGRITCGGNPCSDAYVQVSLLGSDEGPAQQVVPDADGFYQAELTLPGRPDQSMQWVLFASAPHPKTERQAQVSGRFILMEDSPRMTVAHSFAL